MNSVAKQFRSDRSGSIPVIFAAALLPMIGLMGGAIDYSRSIVDKTVLDNALDGAAIVAAKAAQDADAKGLSDKQISAYAEDLATKAFNGTPKVPAGSVPVIKVTIANRSVLVTADYTSATATTVLKAAGFDQINLSGHAESKVDLSPMVDIYLLIDVSARWRSARRRAISIG